MRKFWLVLLSTWKEGPNFGFWLGILIILIRWFLKLPQVVQFISIFVILIAVISIISLITRGFRGLQEEFLKCDVEESLRSVNRSKGNNMVGTLLSNIPQAKTFQEIYDYAERYTRLWASDGVVCKINFYITWECDKISKTAQIFIVSLLRNEELTKYLPSKVEMIKEVRNPSAIVSTKIHSYKYWSDAIRASIEASISDFSKADEIKLQISPLTVKSLYFNFYFKKDNREWTRRFTLEDGILGEEGSIKKDFNTI